MPKNNRVTKKRVLVLATTKPYTRHNIPEHTVANYTCDCGFKGAVQSGLANPHCSSCGSGVTAKVVATASKTKSLSLKECASTVSLLCGNCDTHNLMATASAVDFDGKTHCVSCGSGLEYDTADVIDEDVDLDNETGSDDFAGTTTADSEDEADSIDDIQDEEEAGLDDDDEDIEDLASVDDEDEDASDDEDFLGGDSADEPDEELGETDEDLEDESAMGDHASETPVLATLSKKQLAKARLVHDENKIHIFAGDHCVATAKAKEENSKIFGKPSHLNLITASLADKGVEATADAFGFTIATIKIAESKRLNMAVAKVQADSKGKLSTSLKKHQDVVKQSLEIASLGFTRDAYANEVSNPLKEAVLSTLKSLGVDTLTATVKTQQIFAEAGDEYADVLLAKATEIASLSQPLRTQLMQTFASMAVPTPNYQAVQNEVEHEKAVASSHADDYFSSEQHHGDSRLDNPMRASTTASINNSRRGGAGAESIGTGLFAANTLRR